MSEWVGEGLPPLSSAGQMFVEILELDAKRERTGPHESHQSPTQPLIEQEGENNGNSN